MTGLLLGLLGLLITGWFAHRTAGDLRRAVDDYWGPEAFDPEPTEPERVPAE